MSEGTTFKTCPDSEFFGRDAELGRIVEAASAPQAPGSGLLFYGPRWSGRTELLRRAHARLFWGGPGAVPVYVQLREGETGSAFAESFIRETLRQYLAFAERDTSVLRREMPLQSIERLLADSGRDELAAFGPRHRELKAAGDEDAAVRNALDLTDAVAAAAGAPVFLLLDDVDAAGPVLLRALKASLPLSGAPYAASARSRSALEPLAEPVPLAGLDEEAGAALMAELLGRAGVPYDMEILRLAARKCEGSPMYLRCLAGACRRQSMPLLTLMDFAEAYAAELTAGKLSALVSSAVRLKTGDDLRLLHECSRARGPLTPEEAAALARCRSEEAESAFAAFASAGVVELTLGAAAWTGGAVIADYARYAHDTRIGGRSREEARTNLKRGALKEGFEFKGLAVTASLAGEAARVLDAFSGQKCLGVLFRNSLFSSRLRNGVEKGAGPTETEETALPTVAGTFGSGRFEKHEAGPAMLVSRGFLGGRYSSADEVVWITAVKDSPSPVNAGDAENFLRRSAIVKGGLKPARTVRWFIGREGFTDEAVKRLEGEGVLTSSYQQFAILRERVLEGTAPARPGGALKPSAEFEVSLPAGSRAELVAARAAEEIGTEMGFDEDSIRRIKTALVEACINAFEHGGAKTGKVHVRYVASDDRLTVYVQNGGADFREPPAERAAAAPGDLPRKRGWGLELMRGLMDEVRIERLKEGTRIVLVKYLIGREAGGKRDDKSA